MLIRLSLTVIVVSHFASISVGEQLPFPNCADIFYQTNPFALCTRTRIRQECAKFCSGSSNDKHIGHHGRSHHSYQLPKTAVKKKVESSSKSTPIASTSQRSKSGGRSGCDGMKPCTDLASANAKFSKCCSERGVTKECAFLCDYSKSGSDIQDAVIDDICPVTLLENYLKCAAGENDNTACCTKSGILNPKRQVCTAFCNPMAHSKWPKSLGQAIQYVPCLQMQTKILKCHWANLNDV